jgi:hypothetical protein
MSILKDILDNIREQSNGELNLFTREENEKENKKIYAMEIAHENQKRSHKLLFKLFR